MTDTPALLDRLHDWIVAWDPAGKTFADFDRELAAAHPELGALLDRGELSDQELAAFGVVMSMADVRGFLPDDEDPDSLIRSTPP